MAAARNVLKAWLVTAVVAGLLGALGYALGGLRLASIFGFAGLLLCVTTYWMADRALMGMLGAREVPEGEDPDLHAMVARLASPCPGRQATPVRHRERPAARRSRPAAASGHRPSPSRPACSRCRPPRWKAYSAHELAHVRNRDIVLQTPVVLFSSALLDLSRIGGFLERPLLYVLGPLAAACEHMLLSPKREFAADRLAADVCESPHGLADALIRLEQSVELVEFQASPACEPLFTVNPLDEEGLSGMFVTHPPVAERVQRLRALDPGWRERTRAA